MQANNDPRINMGQPWRTKERPWGEPYTITWATSIATDILEREANIMKVYGIYPHNATGKHHLERPTKSAYLKKLEQIEKHL